MIDMCYCIESLQNVLFGSMNKTTPRKPYMNPPLIKAISSYGRDRFVEVTGISKGMVDGVCAGRRRFGPKKAKDVVAPLLGIDKAVVRPDIWA